MFDFTNITNRETFNYWFERISVTDTWNVYDVESGIEGERKVIGIFDEKYLCMSVIQSGVDLSDTQINAIVSDFHLFSTTRPEYIIGKHIDPKLLDNSIPYTERMNEMRDMYNQLIYSVCYLNNDSDELAKKYADRCVKWLSGTDFYIAPASTIYHDSEPCGLLRHSLKVVDKIIELLHTPSFSNVNVAEAVLSALVHDWCKIDFYEQYMRNVKDETTGVWNKVPSYRCKGTALPFGHGVTSLFMAQKFFRLTTEQALAIRWHMGEYGVSESEKHDLMDANEKYPMVLLIQFADRLSIL